MAFKLRAWSLALVRSFVAWLRELCLHVVCWSGAWKVGSGGSYVFHSGLTVLFCSFSLGSNHTPYRGFILCLQGAGFEETGS